ncbi:putative carboxylesterase [Mycolicibacterium canariasense]|uniref:Carboxylic ester hydrolase n=1 Tax=Mycolicibacterium canariasense TaxID=228230 RepID=A0A100WHD7_MYCCR|nr:carboxylesterase family protein [Mycolicibacterium canariasense]MCV7213472.1 carboxylesterase family protein [Mycolicibacterium canariasense]GAS98564.1 putative carboxylesterase [Mycolicibacterium canariasense]
MATPEVRAIAGTVCGRWEDTVAVFRGIPYAQPPVGALRFAPPAPAQRWDGVRDVASFGPPAPQADAPDSDHDTDWLTLNVWSPDPGDARLPVMVWIHGGRYLEGHTGNPHQNGAILAAAGVVVVSLNYRVGFEGFAHVAGAPNNRGLLDQIAALHWVHDNISAFGGDPTNVTLFGQSAGAGSIAALLTAADRAGLFHRAIIQSLPGTFFTEQLAAAVSAQIAEQLDTQPSAAELQRFSPHTLVTASHALLARMPRFVQSWGPMALTPTPFSPIVDGSTVPESPWRALAAGAARDIKVPFRVRDR